ncbi:Hypothetical predicted protein, partial [Pelobates cultripes]
MPSDKDVPIPTGSHNPNLGYVITPAGTSNNEVVFRAEFDSATDMQSLIDTTTSQAMTKALTSAMGLTSESISQTLTHALLEAQKSAQPTVDQALPSVTPAQPHIGRKAMAKLKHSSISQMDSYTPGTDGAPNRPPRKRANSRAKSARLWKRGNAQLDSESDLSEIEEETYMDPEDPESDSLAEDDFRE